MSCGVSSSIFSGWTSSFKSYDLIVLTDRWALLEALDSLGSVRYLGLLTVSCRSSSLALPFLLCLIDLLLLGLSEV